VPARRALIRSLNVPFVLLLQQYGLEKFHYNLQRLGLSTLSKPPDYYGLSLILGGAEANLLDITNTYACMGRSLGAFYDRDGRYAADDFRKPAFLYRKPVGKSKKSLTEHSDLLSAGSIWFAFEAMREVERPNSSGEWELFRAGQPVAWKTGTSFGFRDAWAAGVTPQYAVGVWVGNADGEGRPGLIGVEFAAPVLFEIFDQLPSDTRWFDPPYDDMKQVPVCRKSGMLAGPYCESDTTWIPESGAGSGVCTYHQLLHLDASRQWQVSSDCESPAQMQHVPSVCTASRGRILLQKQESVRTKRLRRSAPTVQMRDKRPEPHPCSSCTPKISPVYMCPLIWTGNWAALFFRRHTGMPAWRCSGISTECIWAAQRYFTRYRCSRQWVRTTWHWLTATDSGLSVHLKL
jgi:membrane carboxypeptidase/penicillin-binding protein PbpC